MNEESSLNNLESYTVNVSGIEVEVPVKYEELSAVMLFFRADAKKVKEFINNDRITLVKISPNTCLLGQWGQPPLFCK